MNQKAIIVINWMAFLLLTPATIILTWKMISEKLKGKEASSDLIAPGLLLGSASIGIAQLNMEGVGWLRWTLLVVQLILFVFLFKTFWSPLKERLGG
jgi:hypothetical protein